MLNRKEPEWFEVSCLTHHGFAWSTMCAEACLRLVRITDCTSQEYELLLKEGLKCLDASTNTLKNKDGTVVHSVAHSYYSQILSDLENLNAPV